jgi:hypothetical protein
MQAEPIIFSLSEDDRIVRVNEQWTRFAQANGGEHLAPPAVLGTDLWRYISDGSVRELYRMMLQRVRGGRTVRYSFRCDSPAVRRMFAMTVSPGEGGQVEFCSALLQQEERAPLSLLDPRWPRDDRLILVCSWCHRVELDPSLWLEVEEAVARGHHLEAPSLPGLTHGICPSCFQEVRRSLNA